MNIDGITISEEALQITRRIRSHEGPDLWAAPEVQGLLDRIKSGDERETRLRAALKEISEYDEQSIWSDDRDDAADDMLHIAQRALQPLPARWRCRRCGVVVKDGRCKCETSPSPWEPV